MIQSLWQKYRKSMLLPSILVICGLCYFFFSSFDSSPPQEELIETIQLTEQPALTEPAEEAVLQQVFIDIKGAVLHPGVYELNSDQRIIDAIQLAGGYSEDADTRLINHAQKVQDEMVIYIPVKGEQLDEVMVSFNNATFAAGSQTSTNDKVNVNKADNTELTTLAGIGPSKAQSIIAYREENGGFQTIEDIKKVTGIGEKTFEMLKDSITVN
ncbi:helix-hairpin-helix domain-containing protein [Lysinibacillus sp. NPDC093210]|uniref:helix-hairpin-helix domain-containing protein n=1 Tax=Lysinibacillus sp. NPDC093210 TaxID=3364133 RepID=UPI00382B7A0D